MGVLLPIGSFHLAPVGVIVVIAAAWALTWVHFVLEPWRWRMAYLPASVGSVQQAKVRDALYCTAFATYLLPFKLGLPLRVALLKGPARLDFGYIGTVLALDGMLSLATWSVLTVLSLWLAALHWRPPAYIWVMAIACAAVIGAVLMLRRKLRGRFAARWRDALNAFAQPWRRIAKATVVLWLDVLSYGGRHALLLLAVTGSTVNMATGAAIGIVATFAGIVSGLPMGLLGYDATLTALLSATGVPVEHALFMALINRALNIGSAVLLGVPASARLGLGSKIPAILSQLKDLGNGKS